LLRRFSSWASSDGRSWSLIWRARPPTPLPGRLERIAFYASARGLQIGPGVEVIAITSVAANLVAIVGGILVFRDPVGTGALEIVGRMLAFCLVIAGAALIPAPVRATGAAQNSIVTSATPASISTLNE
jgi:hypothetical protein